MTDSTLNESFSGLNSSLSMASTPGSSSSSPSTEYDYESFDLEKELSQTGITSLTKVLASVGIFICIIGIIGNCLSIIVLNTKKMKKLSTYTYLFGLSVCDEISLTFTIIIWIYYATPASLRVHGFQFYYKIILIYVYPIVSSTQALSVWITLAFTVDRYLFICHPYYGQKCCNRGVAFKVLGALFLFAIIYSIPQYLERTYTVQEVINTKQVFHVYTSLGSSKYFIYIYHLFIYCTFVFFIPILLIIVLNVFLINDIIKSNRRHQELNLYASRQSGSMVSESTTHNHNGGGGGGGTSRASEKKSFVQSILLRCLKKEGNIGAAEAGEGTDVEHESCLESSVSPSVQPSHVADRGKRKSGARKIRESIGATMNNDVGIMLVGLIIVFLVCQLPSSMLRLITFNNLSIILNPNYTSLLDISNFLVVSNSTLNCLLYVMLGKKFRTEFFRTFFPRCFNNESDRSDG